MHQWMVPSIKHIHIKNNKSSILENKKYVNHVIFFFFDIIYYVVFTYIHLLYHYSMNRARFTLISPVFHQAALVLSLMLKGRNFQL